MLSLSNILSFNCVIYVYCIDFYKNKFAISYLSRIACVILTTFAYFMNNISHLFLYIRYDLFQTIYW